MLWQHIKQAPTLELFAMQATGNARRLVRALVHEVHDLAFDVTKRGEDDERFEDGFDELGLPSLISRSSVGLFGRLSDRQSRSDRHRPPLLGCVRDPLTEAIATRFTEVGGLSGQPGSAIRA